MAISTINPNSLGGVPAFSAYQGASQAVANNVYTKLTIQTKEYDTNNNFDTSNYRFTPTVAGYYQISWGVNFGPANTGAYTQCLLYKNGASYRQSQVSTGTGPYVLSSSALVYMNGSTDYLEIYTLQATGASQTIGAASTTFMSGVLARSA